VAGIAAVTPDDVRAVAQTVFAPENASVSLVLPRAV
jgi:predicted Zn-dependent peptidase